MGYIPYLGRYDLEPSNIPGMFKTRPWGTYREPIPEESIVLRVNSLADRAMIILDARKDLPPMTLKIRLDKIWFKLNYHFNRIFK